MHEITHFTFNVNAIMKLLQIEFDVIRLVQMKSVNKRMFLSECTEYMSALTYIHMSIQKLRRKKKKTIKLAIL